MPRKKGKRQPVCLHMTSGKTELGNYIWSLRLKLNLKQVPLSKKCGFVSNFVSQIETGKRRYLNDPQLGRLAKALKCDPEELRKRVPAGRCARPKIKLGNLIRSCGDEPSLSLEVIAKKMKLTPQESKHKEIRKDPRIRFRSLRTVATALRLDPAVLAPFVKQIRKESKNELGKLVHNRRKELGMNLGQLADKVEVSRQYIQQIESGKCRLSGSDEMIAKLAQALHLQPAILEAVRPVRRVELAQTANPLGMFLAEQRLNLHLTQQEVGKQAGTTGLVISYIERGVGHPTPHLIGKVAKALHCQIPPKLMPPPIEHKNFRIRPRFNVMRKSPLGKFLTERRLELQLNLAEVGRRADLAASLVSQIERGAYLPGKWVREKLSKALQCEFSDELILKSRRGE
jgi:transcriptional regulator with XRE-family HTH domain